MKLFKFTLASLLAFTSPSFGWDQTKSTVIKADAVSGVSSTPNYWKSGDAELADAAPMKVTTYNDGASEKPVDCTGGTADRVSVARVSPALYDKQSWYITKTAFNGQGQGVAFEFDVDNGIAAREYMEVLFDYLTGDGVFAAGSSTTNSDLMVYIYDVTAGKLIEPFGNNGSKLVKSSTTEKGAYQANFYSTIGSSKYRVCLHQATTNAVYYRLKVDAGKVQKGTLLQGTPPNTFTADISASGVVTADSISLNYFNGTTFAPTDTSLFSVAFKNLSAAPKCQVTLTSANTTDGVYARKAAAETSTSLVIRTGFSNTTTGFGKAAQAFTITCEKQGSDNIQPAVTAANWNFDWRDCPSGFDDNWTNTTVTCKWKRQGGQGYFQYRVLATGVPTGSSIALTLPTGISQDSSRMIQPPGGNYVLPGDVNILDNGSRFFQGTIASLTSTTFTVNALQISPVSNVWESAITPSSPMSWVSGDALTINVNFPVSENGVSWTETWNALQLVGSVTSNSPSAIREEWIVTTSAFCTASPCAIADQSTPGLMSVTRTTTGQYVLNHNMGAGTYCRGPGGAVTTRNSGDTVGVSVFSFDATSAQVHVFLAGVAAFYDARDMMFTCYKKR